MQRQNSILRSPAGPLAWELRLQVVEVQYAVFKNLNTLSGNLPAIRCVPCLPVPHDSEACRLARNGWSRMTFDGGEICLT